MAMDIEKLAEIYNNFYTPAFEIEVENENIIEKGVEVVSVSIENDLNKADHFTFTVNNAFDVIQGEILWMDQLFAFGKKVKIKMGYANTKELEVMLVGIITSVRITFPSGGLPQLEVSGYDLSHCMMKDFQSNSWLKATHSDIVVDMAKKYNQLKCVVEKTNERFNQVSKTDGKSDFQFLSELAQQNYFEFFISGETLYFRAPKYDREPVVTLEWGKSLISFSPEVNVANQITTVEVRGWDPVNKKEFLGIAEAGDELEKKQRGNRQSGGELVQKIYGKSPDLSLSYPVSSQQEADQLAKSILNQHAEGLVTGSGETIGIPKILPGENIFLKGLGKKFSKSYYIESSNHSISSSGYRTTFHVKESII